ncbi:hypothetical protein NKI89_07170 [Mesorhizobium sp. M0309]|uniref:hypothetical protein n=1 Tax=Mesorhizobium sp. M0309 TaxID=2956933 RepID=UPI0033389A76
MSSGLLTMSAYAATIGVNPSTVSRAVERGSLPVVVLSDGRRMIDRQAADAARRQNSNIKNGHGGRPDRAERRRSTWRAKSATGFDPAILAALHVMRGRWPTLIRKAMAVLGAAEIDQARAVLSLSEMVAYLAALVHEERNRAGVWDWRKVVEDEPKMSWTDPATIEFVERWGEAADGTGVTWTSDEGGIEGGSELAQEFLDAGLAAKP